MRPSHQDSNTMRLKVVIHGVVQGVGFRPFVYRLAKDLGLTGWVSNSSQGVWIEVEGAISELENFLLRLESDKPPHSFIQSLESSYLDPVGMEEFEIRPSLAQGKRETWVMPDVATCPDCLGDISDPQNRRYRYPFTNCTNCGPRFSIIEALPYDRINTTMKKFQMCEACLNEYNDPLNRRFHAEANACPQCGPHLEAWNIDGKCIARNKDALSAAEEAIRSGKILALKGIGGFQLMADARSDDALRTLRTRKAREEKPFALMYPTLALLREDCEVSALEERLLQSSESPIVLLHRLKKEVQISSQVAPKNPYLGVMLPYSPLHFLLMSDLVFPVVATSGNLSDEPIAIDEYEALKRLKDIADLFLVHNRPIARHVDDSIVRIVSNREMVLRRARGYAPLPIHCKEEFPALLAVGGHMKNTVANAQGHEVFISQHVGDLATEPAYQTFQNTIQSLKNLYQLQPTHVACDLHPDYLSTQYAKASTLESVPVQHHYAHILSCMAENELDSPLLGIAWDGTGYGPDGTIWGGEFLKITQEGFRRVSALDRFQIPGGDAGSREPRRAALGLLYQIYGEDVLKMNGLEPLAAFSRLEKEILVKLMKKKVNAPFTSSAGRLFDAVASLTGLRQTVKQEGEAAMELEFALEGIETEEFYPFHIQANDLRGPHPWEPEFLISWEAMIRTLLQDLGRDTPLPLISAKFHNTLVAMIIDVAKKTGETKVVLSGGCFQNKYLLEHTVAALQGEGFRPYWHQRVPPNDGGLSLGQILAAARRIRKELPLCA